MLRQLQPLTFPIVISIVFFSAAFLVAAKAFSLTGPQVLLGIVAGACGALCVLLIVLWKRAKTITSRP
jgi:O-antigen/teichoic acid export membrane protein